MEEELPGEYMLHNPSFMELGLKLGAGLDGEYAYWRTVPQLAEETDFTEMELRALVPRTGEDNNPLSFFWAVLADGTRLPVAQVAGVREYWRTLNEDRAAVPEKQSKPVQAWTIREDNSVTIRNAQADEVEGDEYLLLEHAALVCGRSVATLRQAITDKVLNGRQSPITGTQVLVQRADLDALATRHYTKKQRPVAPTADDTPMPLAQAASLVGVNYEALAQAAKRGKLQITYGARNGGKERLTTLAAIASWRGAKYLRATS